MARTPILRWDDTSAPNDTAVTWTAEKIAKEFHLDKDTHVGLVKARGQETGGSAAAQSLTMQADLAQRDEGAVNLSVVSIGPDAPVDGPKRGEMLWLRGDAEDTYLAEDQPTEMIEIFQSLTFFKVSAATWDFLIDYVILEGPMRWRSEDYFKDMFSVNRQVSAGNPYFQPGATPGEPFHKVRRSRG